VQRFYVGYYRFNNIIMEETANFIETQKFRQWWLWLILLIINIFSLMAVYGQEAGDVESGLLDRRPTRSVLALAVTLAISVLFAIMKLETHIVRDGIKVRFFPFHIKYKTFSWDSISGARVRCYSPIGEFGGWGLRIGIGSRGSAYNVSGNKGLQLEFKNGKKLLIGTNKASQLEIAIKRTRI